MYETHPRVYILTLLSCMSTLDWAPQMHEFLEGLHDNLDNPPRKQFLEAKTLGANPSCSQFMGGRWQAYSRDWFLWFWLMSWSNSWLMIAYDSQCYWFHGEIMQNLPEHPGFSFFAASFAPPGIGDPSRKKPRFPFINPGAGVDTSRGDILGHSQGIVGNG